jgi:hypothetical protein
LEGKYLQDDLEADVGVLRSFLFLDNSLQGWS